MYARFFHEVDDKLLNGLIRVNVEGTTKVTQAVLAGMLKRKKGAIVNIGSGAAMVIPSDPLYTVYAATKAYVDLYVEYKNSGIDVQCQVPRRWHRLDGCPSLSHRRTDMLVLPCVGLAMNLGARLTGRTPSCGVWRILYQSLLLTLGVSS